MRVAKSGELILIRGHEMARETQPDPAGPTGQPPPPPASPPTAVPSQAAGEETDDSEGRAIDEGRGRVFPCPTCGGELVFDVREQCLKCPHCGSQRGIELPAEAAVIEQDLRASLARLKEEHGRRRGESPSVDEGENHVRCESCGGTVVFLGTLTSAECPYCGVPVQREHVHVGGWRLAVDGVLPFRIPREKAAANLAAWVKSRWFAPSEFLERGAQGRFNGVYLPFWTFDAETHTVYQGQRGDYYWETVGSGNDQRRVRRTSWSPAAGQFERSFDDVLISAGRGVAAGLLDALDPWPLPSCIPFTRQVLAGFLARTYDVELEDGFAQARTRIEQALESDVRSRIGGDEQSIDDLRTAYGGLSFKHLLLPVWLMVYRYQGRPYQVVVNAGTGEVTGERPYSAWKIAFAVLVAMAAVAAVMLLRSR
jgi:predicted RNA-binding Zn-ribbon protein involved in translation (DUF1610 family)